jgi:hypothetical protein
MNSCSRFQYAYRQSWNWSCMNPFVVRRSALSPLLASRIEKQTLWREILRLCTDPDKIFLIWGYFLIVAETPQYYLHLGQFPHLPFHNFDPTWKGMEFKGENSFKRTAPHFIHWRTVKNVWCFQLVHISRYYTEVHGAKENVKMNKPGGIRKWTVPIWKCTPNVNLEIISRTRIPEYEPICIST